MNYESLSQIKAAADNSKDFLIFFFSINAADDNSNGLSNFQSL